MCARSKSPGAASLSFRKRRAPALSALDPGFDKLRRLTEISRALTYTTSLEQVVQLAVERARELLDAEAAVLMLPGARGVFHVRASHGLDAERLAHMDAPTDEQLFAHLHELLGVPYDRLVAVPLVVHGDVTGVLAVTTQLPFTGAQEWLLSALADQAAVAIENARLDDEVRVEQAEQLRVSEDAGSAKDRALATLAHDIRTPLGAIEAYCSVLEAEVHGAINDRQRETLGRVRMSGRHLLSLLDNVMEMVRLSAGAVRLSTEHVSLRDVARDAVQITLPAAEAKLQKLQLGELADGIVLADPGRLRQVLVNLIDNAVKFTPPDGSVSISATVRNMTGALWGEVRITDSGPGIPQAQHQAIFEPYYRSETAAQIPGIGLGLAISQALVKQMGGELDLVSDVGSGSSFSVRLPLITRTV